VLLLACAALQVASLAQNPSLTPALVHGSITTAQGQPAADVSVELRDIRGVRMGTAITNNAGNFEIKTSAAAGEYVLLAAKEPELTGEQITLGGSDPYVRIAMPSSPERTAPRPSDYTVSANRLSVSDKARKHIQTAQMGFSKLDFMAARKELDLAIESDPQCAPAFTMRAFVRLAAADLSGAIDDANRAAAIDPDDPQSYLATATAYNSFGRFREGAQAASQALMIDLDSWQARLELAKALYGNGMYVLALHEIDLLEVDFPDVHLVRGNVLMRLGRREEGVSEFRAFLRLAPNDQRGPRIRQIVCPGTSTP